MSFEQPLFTADMTTAGVLRLLEKIRALDPEIWFYQARSARSSLEGPRDTPDRADALLPAQHARHLQALRSLGDGQLPGAYGLFACSGICLNHEAPLRGLEFVTRKITQAVVRIRLGFRSDFVFGTLDTRRDWGYAPEYVEAM